MSIAESLLFLAPWFAIGVLLNCWIEIRWERETGRLWRKAAEEGQKVAQDAVEAHSRAAKLLWQITH